MYIILQKAVDIERDEKTGAAWTWKTTGQNIETFTNPDKFMEYVKVHANDLQDVIAFSSSASQIAQANLIIADQLKHAGLL